MRPLSMIGMVLVIAAAAGLFRLKHEVQQLEAELISLDRTLIEEREAIRVLHAEWSYLNRPERLLKLSDRYLKLVPLVPSQVGPIYELSEPAGMSQRAELNAGVHR